MQNSKFLIIILLSAEHSCNVLQGKMSFGRIRDCIVWRIADIVVSSVCILVYAVVRIYTYTLMKVVL